MLVRSGFTRTVVTAGAFLYQLTRRSNAENAQILSACALGSCRPVILNFFNAHRKMTLSRLQQELAINLCSDKSLPRNVTIYCVLLG